MRWINSIPIVFARQKKNIYPNAVVIVQKTLFNVLLGVRKPAQQKKKQLLGQLHETLSLSTGCPAISQPKISYLGFEGKSKVSFHCARIMIENLQGDV